MIKSQFRIQAAIDIIIFSILMPFIILLLPSPASQMSSPVASTRTATAALSATLQASGVMFTDLSNYPIVMPNENIQKDALFLGKTASQSADQIVAIKNTTNAINALQVISTLRRLAGTSFSLSGHLTKANLAAEKTALAQLQELQLMPFGQK